MYESPDQKDLKKIVINNDVVTKENKTNIDVFG